MSDDINIDEVVGYLQGILDSFDFTRIGTNRSPGRDMGRAGPRSIFDLFGNGKGPDGP
jgi:hypothetical protein